MTLLKPEKNLWYNKGYSRKKQIYEWFDDVVSLNGLSYFYQDIYYFISTNEHAKAFGRFEELLSIIRDGNLGYENASTLGYLINENIIVFGYSSISNDLYSEVILTKASFKISKSKKITKPVTVTTPIQLRHEYQERKKTFRGYNTQNKLKEAKLNIYIIKTTTGKIKELYVLRDSKTGRFLRHTKSFKKELAKRRKGD